jgi:hypothetical protein
VVALRYGFHSPQTGRWIEEGDSQIRKDLNAELSPARGIPVHVLYLDDQTYMVL